MNVKILTAIIAVSLILIFSFSANAQTNGNSARSVEKDKKQETDRPLQIVKRPHAATDGRCEGRGLVRFRVTFHSSGEITEVETLLLSECDYFNRTALEAARKIKFKPKIVNGEPVSVSKMVEFQYSTY